MLGGTLGNMSYMFMSCVMMRPAFVRVSFVHECIDVYAIRAYAHMCARHDVKRLRSHSRWAADREDHCARRTAHDHSRQLPAHFQTGIEPPDSN